MRVVHLGPESHLQPSCFAFNDNTDLSFLGLPLIDTSNIELVASDFQ